MARHRSPQGRRAHLGPPLSAALAAAGVGGAHRSISVPLLTSSLPARFVATAVVGGALAATAQHALAETLPAAADTTALRLALEDMIGSQDRSTAALDADAIAAPAVAPVVPESLGSAAASLGSLDPAAVTELAADLPVADAASLVKAADLHRAAAEAAAAAAAAAEAAARAAEEARVAEAARASDAARAEAAGPAAPASVGGTVQMVVGRVTSGFGARWGSSHQGLDIAAPIGTPIRVPLAGTVVDSGPASGFGQWVRVRHADGTITVYGHINRALVRKGEEVAAGQVIAEVGNRGRSTGPHLHIEVVSPSGKKINPRPWLDERAVGY